MKKRLVELDQKPPKSTIVQVYNAEQIMLITPLAKLYLNRGLKISKITKFIQYIPAKCFEPFTKKVTKLRIEADREGDTTKATTAKLFGNSAYGKTG